MKEKVENKQTSRAEKKKMAMKEELKIVTDGSDAMTRQEGNV